MTILADLDTPCLILDRPLSEGNLARMQDLASAHGKQLRPHAKTHKCSRLAARQLELGGQGVCVAKVSEAAALIAAGIEDILVTGPVSTPQKVRALVDLLVRAPALKTVVDHEQQVECLAAELAKRGLTLDVLLDIDIGLARSGVLPEDAPKLAETIFATPALRLVGVQAYAGQVQHISNYAARSEASLSALAPAVSAFREIRSSYPDCTIFSSTGTGTADVDLAVPDVTELQVGSYALMDVEYGDIQAAGKGALLAEYKPALRLLTSVVSANHDTHVTVDAGLKSVYRHGGTPRVWTPEYRHLRYDWFGDEYGRLFPETRGPLPGLGELVELVVSHCDPTVNLFDRYFVVDGHQAVDEWEIDLRGCSR